MGQFKPMVKMMTTEPTVELKLKKGGKVEKKMQMGGLPDAAPAMPSRGGMMPARGGMMPGMAPKRPPLMARRKAMMAMPGNPGPAGPVGPAAPMMKKGGKAEVGESRGMHKAEMAEMSKLEREMKSHEGKPASKAHKGLKTGGVVMGQGGYKAGGIINTEGQGGEYRNTKMHTAKAGSTSGKTGGVKLGNGAGYKAGGGVKGNGYDGNVSTTPPGVSNTTTGGVRKGNAGGFKKGGKVKGMMDGGMAGDGMMDSRMMGDGMSPYGAYKKGGSAKKYARGGAVVQDDGGAEKMPQGRKNPSAPVSITALSGTFKKGGSVKKMNQGGSAGKTEDMSKGAYDRHYSDQKKENEAMRDAILGAPGRMIDRVKGFLGGVGNKPDLPAGSVTKTEKSVTVAPGKKRGGMVNC